MDVNLKSGQTIITIITGNKNPQLQLLLLYIYCTLIMCCQMNWDCQLEILFTSCVFCLHRQKITPKKMLRTEMKRYGGSSTPLCGQHGTVRHYEATDFCYDIDDWQIQTGVSGRGPNRWTDKESPQREKRTDRESGNRGFYWTVWILKAPKIWPRFYLLWWKHGVRCDVKTLHGVWGPFGPSVPEAPEVQPASRSRGYSFASEMQPETADGKPCEPGVPSGHERRTQANSRWGVELPIIRLILDLYVDFCSRFNSTV